MKSIALIFGFHALVLASCGCGDDDGAAAEQLDSGTRESSEGGASLGDASLPEPTARHGSAACDAAPACVDASDMRVDATVKDPDVDASKRTVEVTIAKWYDNHAGQEP